MDQYKKYYCLECKKHFEYEFEMYSITNWDFEGICKKCIKKEKYNKK